jgi:hypothetical protein
MAQMVLHFLGMLKALGSILTLQKKKKGQQKVKNWSLCSGF